jgi:aspartate-semialdehyde dehydrogenase
LERAYRIAILGATGVVGTEILQILEERKFPVGSLVLLASARSAGKHLPFRGTFLPVQSLSEKSFEGIDLVFASAGGSISKQWAPHIVQAGATLIDNSSAFRMTDGVPLVVPEVNPEDLRAHQGIIANPNCSTILMTLALWPLHQVRPIKRVICSTYQAASGAGAAAMEELQDQTRDVLAGRDPNPQAFPHPIAFNLFPHNSPMTENRYCEEELKMIYETQKIFHNPYLRVSATCVRVPVLRAHAESINIEFHEPFPIEEATNLLKQAPGVMFTENWQSNTFAMPLDASGQDPVMVGRVRQDLSCPEALELWLCGDQIRKGAALNAVQIGEWLVQNDLVSQKSDLVSRV